MSVVKICNEPYLGGVTLEWQHHMTDVIWTRRKNYKKLISRNVATNAAEGKTRIPPFLFSTATTPRRRGLCQALDRLTFDD